MKGRTDAPLDRGWLVGIIFFILGLGTLLPWNFFMTATVYFNSRLNTTEWVNGTSVTRREYYFNNWMTLLSQLPLLLCTFLNSFLYQWISERMRIAGCQCFILALFILTAILVKVPMEEDAFFSITMTTIWFINSFGAVCQGSLFGLVGQLPPSYNAVFMSGQGLAGAFAAIAMIISLASDAAPDTAALGYFITPCVGTVITLTCYLLLPTLEFAQYYLDKSKRYEPGTTDELLRDKSGKLNGHSSVALDNGGSAGDLECVAMETGEESTAGGSKQAFLELEAGPEDPNRKSSVLEVFRKIWVMAFCVTFVFTVTLAVFPAVTVDVKSYYPGNWERYFISVCCFLMFNVMDWIGRSVTSVVRWPGKDSILFPGVVVLRVVFIPLLMLCNVQPRSSLPVWFHHDLAFTFIMMLFSFSSGYTACLSMSYAPQFVEPKDEETAGIMMMFFLALGLSIGAGLSFPLRALL